MYLSLKRQYCNVIIKYLFAYFTRGEKKLRYEKSQKDSKVGARERGVILRHVLRHVKGHGLTGH